MLALDGVYVPGPTPEAPPVFVPATAPTREQLLALVTTVARRTRLLTDREVANDDAQLAEPVQKLFDDEPPPAREDPRLQAAFDGFDLHAGTTLDADDRTALERFLRYCLRGPVANSRLTKGPGNKLIYQLKSRRRDGATAIRISPLALLERLSWLVPNPGQHLIRYHGVLAANARWRPRIVPASPLPGVVIKGRRRLDWQSLLRRVFAYELLLCVCGATRRVIAVIERGPVATRILKHLGLPWELPRLAPARTDQGEIWPTGPPRDDGEPPLPDPVEQRSAFAAEDVDQRPPFDLSA